MTTIILDMGAGTVRHGDRVAAVPPAAARFLRGLALCGDGFLAAHIVGRSDDTIRVTRTWPLHTAFRAIGVSSSVERVRWQGIAGHRLPSSLRVLVAEDDHPHASTIAATTTQPSATAPASSTTRIDHSSKRLGDACQGATGSASHIVPNITSSVHGGQDGAERCAFVVRNVA